MFSTEVRPPSPKRRAAKTASGENKVSCMACRTVKCKCVESDDPGSRCQRCTRLDIACVYQAHQRGRRRKDGSVATSDTPGRVTPQVRPLQPPKRKRSGDERGLSHDSFGPTISSQLGGDGGALLAPNSHQYGATYSRSSSPRSFGEAGQDQHGGGSDSDDRPNAELDQPPANSVYHDVANRSIFSIAGVMERESDRTDVGDGSTPTLPAEDDPIALGMLSMDECDSLFWHYFDQLQTCVCLLDPAVHTARYTRKASLQLFSAVLAVSSKFFRPELYEASLAAANRLLNQAIADCVCTIELVQAICILHYWKKPTDSRGWLRLGHAIRLGYQLDLHLPRKGKLPTDERDARLAIDRERTWISLFCFDSTMTQLSDRPSMMHKTPEVSAWIRSIPYPLPSDGQLDFAVKTSLLSSEVRQMQSCRGSYEVLRSGLRRILEDLHHTHQLLTAANAPVKLTSTSQSINKFSTLAVQLLVECTSLSFAPRKHRISLLHACVATSLDLLDTVVEGFARKGIMPMIEDAHSVAVASTAVRLIRFMAYLDSSAKASVMRKLTKVVIVCREAARGDQECHSAYLARYIHALLDKAHQSRQPSRASSPTTRQVPRMTAAVNIGAPSLSPVNQNTTPDQWWDEVGQFAYQQEPLQPLKEYQDFWDGFPLLAGAMNTLGPIVQTDDPSGSVDTNGASAFTGLPWDDAWDVSFLGGAHAQGPPMI